MVDALDGDPVRIMGPGGGLGDELGVTPCLGPVADRYPNERILLLEFRFPEIFKGHPALVRGGKDNTDRSVQLVNAAELRAPSIPRKFARQLGIELLDDTPRVYLNQEDLHVLDNISLGGGRSVAIDAFAMDPSRRWPWFPILASALRLKGWVVVEVGRNVHKGRVRIPHDLSFLDKLSVRETAALLSAVDLYVGNDSGLFHLAAAVGTPQVVPFGLTPWNVRRYWNTIPLGNEDQGCAGCNRVCNIPMKDNPQCLSKISVEDMMAGVELAVERFVE